MRFIYITLFSLLFTTASLFTTEIAPNEGIAIKETALLKSPAKDAVVIGTIKRGERFKIISKSDNFENNESTDYYDPVYDYYYYKVKTNEQVGWVFQRNIGINIAYEQANSPGSITSFKRYNNKLLQGLEGATLWFCRGDYIFSGLRAIYPVISNNERSFLLRYNSNINSDNSLFLFTEEKASLKSFEIKDIAGDTVPEIIVEQSYESFTDPTNGSFIKIFSFDSKLNEFISEFTKHTSYFTHGATTVFSKINIEKNKLEVLNIERSGDVIRGYKSQSEKADQGNFKALYIWKDSKYTLAEKEELTFKCSPTVNSLRIRKSKGVKSEQVGSLKRGEEAELLYFPDFDGRRDRYEVVNGKRGLWVRVKKSNLEGYTFSFYLDFDYDFLNEILKSDSSSSSLINSKEYNFISYR